MPRRRKVKLVQNPEHAGHLPYDEWIPAHAVIFNSDGSVSLMTEKDAHRNTSVQFGHWAGGTFHPWRASKDYIVGKSAGARKAGERRGGAKYKTKRGHAKPSDYMPFSQWTA